MWKIAFKYDKKILHKKFLKLQTYLVLKFLVFLVEYLLKNFYNGQENANKSLSYKLNILINFCQTESEPFLFCIC